MFKNIPFLLVPVFLAAALLLQQPIETAAAPVIVFQSVAGVTEITGDGDSWLEPGEKFSVQVTLSNIGDTAASGVSASLAATGAEVCAPNSRSFGDIGIGGTGSVAFEFVISGDFSPCGGSLLFDVTGKTCQEASPAGIDETAVFGFKVGQDSGGSTTTLFGPDTLTTPDPYTFDNWIADGYTYKASWVLCNDQGYARSTANPGTYHLTLKYPVSTVGYTQVTVVMDWGVNHSTATQYLDWSTDGISWNLDAAVTNFVPATCGQQVTLPAGAAGRSSLYIRFRSEVPQNNVLGQVDYISILGYAPSWDCSYTGAGACTPPLPPEVAWGDDWTWSSATQSTQVMNWTPVTADGYRVYRGTRDILPELCGDSVPDFCLAQTVSSPSCEISADDPASADGRCFFYLISAYNATGEGTTGSTSVCGFRIINNSCP